jgi:sugar diacid utilization regulator
VRENLVIAVLSATRRMSGWTAAQETLAGQLRPRLLTIGPAALVGVSTDQPSTSYVPKGLDEARLSLDFASVSDRVVQFKDIPFRQIVLRAGKDGSQYALPDWLDVFLQADRKARGSLLATLRAYANANMNVLQSAKALSVHPNTIYSRLQRVDDITRKNPLSYTDLTELLLVIDCKIDDHN